MSAVKVHWNKVKKNLLELECYSLEDTKLILQAYEQKKQIVGKACNRTLLKDNPNLYKSIFRYTTELEECFKKQGSDKNNYNLVKRVRFILDHNLQIEQLKCKCGKSFGWTPYCRKCPEPKKNQLNKPHTESTRLKMRQSALAYIKALKGQVAPRYNKSSIKVIEAFGEQNGYVFMHAENGGEYFVEQLGYFLDAYDPVNNVALEIDEQQHFDTQGFLKVKDIERQKQIENLLGCTFIRIKHDRINTK